MNQGLFRKWKVIILFLMIALLLPGTIRESQATPLVDGTVITTTIGAGETFTIGAGATVTVSNGGIVNGAIDIAPGGTLILEGNGQINRGVQVGGTFNMTGGLITNTFGDSSARGVNVDGTFIMSGGEISGNTNDWGGAGVLVNGTFEMNQGLITNNSAFGFGGGVFVQSNGDFTMNGGEIIANTAGWDGGGVNVSSNANFTMTNGKINNNTASNAGGATTGGGGVFLAWGSSFIFADGEINGNNAVNGGGVLVTFNSDFIMNGGEINGNTATGNGAGGGVDISASNFEMNGGEINGNTNGGVATGSFGGISTFTMTDGEINNNISNDSGSGVRVISGVFTMEGGEIVGNTTDQNGGGVYLGSLAGSTSFIQEGGTIYNNTALNNGGGVYVSSSSIFTIQGTGNKNISNNQAINGGGVYLAGTWSGTINLEMLPGTTNMSFTGNIVTGMGGAIFTGNYEYNTNMLSSGSYGNITIMPGTVFSGNTAYAAYQPPVNAATVTNIPGSSQSIYNHPINNYDINFVNYNLQKELIDAEVSRNGAEADGYVIADWRLAFGIRPGLANIFQVPGLTNTYIRLVDELDSRLELIPGTVSLTYESSSGVFTAVTAGNWTYNIDVNNKFTVDILLGGRDQIATGVLGGEVRVEFQTRVVGLNRNILGDIENGGRLYLGDNDPVDSNKARERVYGVELVQRGTGGIYLAGSLVRLYKAEDIVGGNVVTGATPIAIRTSDVNGRLSFYGLLSGTYYLSEITAPTGYNLLTEPIQIVFNDQTEFAYDYLLIVETQRSNSELPNTGGMGSIMYTLLGITLLCSGASVWLLTKKKRESLI